MNESRLHVAERGRPRLGVKPKVGGEGHPEVFVADEQDEVAVEVERWQQLALDVITAEGVRGLAELALLFVSEVEMRELNEDYMGKPGPTDVLAFPIDAADAELVNHGQPPSRGPDRAPSDPSDMPLLLGDVVICPAVALAQAPSHAGTMDDEMALLVVHGVLHVLGHDHDDEASLTAMRSRERELLETYHWRGPTPAQFRQEHSEQ
jgi:probable rRNA maturation factor